ncbi:NeuD/PglB/VioB family sugar acetyltransferase [Flavobacterium tibetense]|uniref:Acetyltransferase n=1 Tax=Flavobacterium tibetense TaxID=2233533 RepID=A0A365P3N0_9FLAO|nr:NeuD/PglB/VioB family sugar acetyltransferase [Flavobacterium tibetense]RBA29127.1 acetyltransferase [Flavobacterium tibetense]
MSEDKKRIVLIGGGGHCLSVIDVVEQQGKYNILGILDSNPNVKTLLGYPVLGGDELIPEMASQGVFFLITVGQIKSVELRKKIANILDKNNAQLAKVISPLSYVSKHAKIKDGTIIMHHALVNAMAKVGKHCIINSKADIEHGVVIEDFCHISTAAVVNGDAKVGKETFIGSNAVLAQSIEVKSNSVIGAGTFVK